MLGTFSALVCISCIQRGLKTGVLFESCGEPISITNTRHQRTPQDHKYGASASRDASVLSTFLLDVDQFIHRLFSCFVLLQSARHYQRWWLHRLARFWKDLSRVATEGKCIAVCETSPHRYGKSLIIWDHTVLTATRQRWLSRLYPSRSWYSI